MVKVLMVDDDPNLQLLVAKFLRQAGFETHLAADGVEALEFLSEEQVDLVIVDVMMPRMDGWELCRTLREDYDLAILMLTAKGESRQKVKGFSLGADDYLVKPFDPEELVARVKALLRRYRIAAEQRIRLGSLMLDRKTYECRSESRSFTLPNKEFELLFILACHAPRTLTRDQLIELVWGYDFGGNERTVDVHINRLRTRFEKYDADWRIVTVRGLGYRLEVEA